MIRCFALVLQRYIPVNIPSQAIYSWLGDPARPTRHSLLLRTNRVHTSPVVAFNMSWNQYPGQGQHQGYQQQQQQYAPPPPPMNQGWGGQAPPPPQGSVDTPPGLRQTSLMVTGGTRSDDRTTILLRPGDRLPLRWATTPLRRGSPLLSSTTPLRRGTARRSSRTSSKASRRRMVLRPSDPLARRRRTVRKWAEDSSRSSSTLSVPEPARPSA